MSAHGTELAHFRDRHVTNFAVVSKAGEEGPEAPGGVPREAPACR
jgi:hypothetical protein